MNIFDELQSIDVSHELLRTDMEDFIAKLRRRASLLLRAAESLEDERRIAEHSTKVRMPDTVTGARIVAQASQLPPAAQTFTQHGQGAAHAAFDSLPKCHTDRIESGKLVPGLARTPGQWAEDEALARAAFAGDGRDC